MSENQIQQECFQMLAVLLGVLLVLGVLVAGALICVFTFVEV